MSAELLALIAGTVLSLMFSYIPGLNTKFASLDTEKKRLIMLGLLALCAGGIYGLACLGLAESLHLQVTCTQQGGIELVQAFILAVIANQGVYSITPDTDAVKKVWEKKYNAPQ